MPVELRKRKAPAQPAPPPPAKKRSNPVKNAASKVKAAITAKSPQSNGTKEASIPTVGSSIIFGGFGGEIETHDGTKTTFEKLVADSKAGVVLFTYPKASTPGCTKQACLFRDSYKPLTATGYDIYGLSRDSPKANTTFKERQSLPYPLLCDTKGTLIAAIGLKKAPSSTTRGVFVVDKGGKVLAAEPGGPDATVEVVRKLVGGADTAMPDAAAESKPEVDAATTTSTKKEAAPAAPATTETKPAETETAETNSKAEPAGSAVTKEPMPATPAENAAKAATAAHEKPVVAVPSAVAAETSTNGAPKESSDAAIAKVAADVADTASKVDPATPNPA